MKKTILLAAAVLGMACSSFAQNGGGLFGKGPEPMENSNNRTNDVTPMLPSQHGNGGDTNAPLGSGVALLFGMGAAYYAIKKQKED